jgi:hypothetical protein
MTGLSDASTWTDEEDTDEEVKFQVEDVLRYYFSVNDEISIIPSR